MKKKEELKTQSVKSIAFPGFLARAVVVVVDNSLLLRIIPFCVPDCSPSCLLKALVLSYVYLAKQVFPCISGIINISILCPVLRGFIFHCVFFFLQFHTLASHPEWHLECT